MTPLTAFMPFDRRYALASGQTLADRTHGAVLFADISGFTPLTAALADELGPHRGAEELTRHLNRVFTALIAQVHSYRGSVMNFSGDAITCWFDQTESHGRSAQLALACALSMQVVMQEQAAIATPNGRVARLGLKVALASGPARRFLVGKPAARQIEVLAGATLDHMAAAEKLARQGEVVATAELLAQLDPAVRPAVAQWRTDESGQRFAIIRGLANTEMPSRWQEPAGLTAEAARPWLLAPVYARLQQGPDEFLAELRPAVALFIKFSGIDYDGDEEAGAKLDAFIKRVQIVLDRYEGFLLQITMGDKGSYLYISFGAPQAHEDDANRAAAAALDLQQLPSEFPFLQPLQIGLSQGLTYSGAYGSPHRRTYAVMGTHVNISARLMTQALPGQILVSRPIVEALNDEFARQTLPPVALKGIAGPFPLWELRERQAPATAASARRRQEPLVGREAELQLLTAALADVAHGRSRVLLLEGAAGIGKSRLVQMLLQEAETSAVQILFGQGDAIDKSTPYHAWRPVFEQLFALPTGSGADDLPGIQAQILAQLPPEVHHLAPLLTAVLPVAWPDTALTAQIEGQARQDNTHLLLVGVLQAASARRPLLLVLDDTHWLDSLSWTLVQRVARQVQRLLLVLVTRPLGDEAPAVYTELQAQPETETVVLDTLPPEAIEALVQQRLGVDQLPPSLVTLIHSKAEGNPFFSEELAYALRDARLIVIEDGVCRSTADLTNLDALDFPTTIQGVITSRIDLLPPQQQLTVKVASVIGRIFVFRVLSDIYPAPASVDELLHNLGQLERLDITPMESPEPDLAYLFKHIVTQEVVYSLMTFAQRRQLHRNTAVWYENTQAGEQAARLYPLLAYHWRHAGDVARAVDYYGKAGSDAFRKYANQEAIRFLSQALALSAEAGADSPSLLTQVRWQRQLGEATYRLTLMDESRDHYETALSQIGYPLPPGSVRRALGLTRQLLKQVGHRWRPGRFVGRASAAEREVLLEGSRLYDSVAEIYYNEGDFLSSFYCVMRAFNLAEEAGISSELVRGYANMCATLGSVSLNKMADNYRRRAVKMAAKVDDLATRAYIQIPLSSHSLWVGNWQRAEAEISEALDIYARLGDWRRWCVAAWLWPQVVESQGRLQAARELWAELLAVAQRSNDTRHEVRSQGGRMFNFVVLGQWQAAAACVTAVGVLLDENPEMKPVEERLWHALNARLALHEGRWDDARQQTAALLDAIERARFKFDLLDVFATAVEVNLALWARGEATEAEARTALKVLQQYARTYAFARPRLLRSQARLAWQAGKQGRAQKLWRQGVDKAAAPGMEVEQGAIWHEMGHCLADDRYRQQAQAVAQETGAVFTDPDVTPHDGSRPAARD